MAHFLIVTFGMTPHNSRLMPWRTVAEVASGMRSLGHRVSLVSVLDYGLGAKPPPDEDLTYLTRIEIKSKRGGSATWLRGATFDAIFVPVSISPNRLVGRLLRNTRGPRLAYLPGSAFELGQVLPILHRLPFRQALPYMRQAVTPVAVLGRSLRRLGVEGLIVNTGYSQRRLKRCIPVPIVAIGPGRDPVKSRPRDDPVTRHENDQNGGHFVFMGPPLPIRGTYVLLEAYLRIADDPRVPPLHCLFRSDIHLDIAAIEGLICGRWAHPKLRFTWSSLGRAALDEEIDRSIAVVMPFLVVPSEIPLAIFEAAGRGKTVITSGPSGTAEFVSPFGEIVRPGSAADLAAAMKRVAYANDKNPTLVNPAAVEAHSKILTWQEVTRRWEMMALQLRLDK